MITMASIFFAIFFCVLLICFSIGAYEKMIDNMLRTQAGHIQIHAKDYWDNKIIDNFMFMDTVTISALENIYDIENVSPRVETFSMASFGSLSKGIAVIGISPKKEAAKSNLPSHILKGEYLSEHDNGILIGEGLAKYLKVTTGDTLAFIGQGYHGSSAAGLFPIRGILKLIIGNMDNGMAYMTLSSAQQFIDMPDGYSGILISIKNDNRLDEVIHKIKSTVNTQTLDIYPWHFTMERLLQTMKSDTAFSVLMSYILYVIVGFGILGTVIMMTNERKREFCVVISLGMARIKLVIMTVVELLIMSLIAIIASIAVTLPIAHWFNANPIDLGSEMAEMYAQFGMEALIPMSVEPSIFINQIVTIFVIILLTMIYPINKILKLKIING
jgi:ABC-type lipoprotein release transport system permease subunit